MGWLYSVSRFAAWCWVKVWFRTRAHGRENIPLQGPVILACSHASHLDPLVMGVFVPRQCRYVARLSLGRIPLVGAWMRGVGVIFIDRKAPSREAMTTVIDALRGGSLVGMFPEGTRAREPVLGPFQRGILLLAKKSQAAVVPVGIRGSLAALPPGAILPRPRRISVHFGVARTAEEVLAPGGLEALRGEVAALCDIEMS